MLDSNHIVGNKKLCQHSAPEAGNFFARLDKFCADLSAGNPFIKGLSPDLALMCVHRSPSCEEELLDGWIY